MAVEPPKISNPHSLQARNQAAEIKLRAERKLGELLAAMEKHKGGNPNRSHNVTGSSTLKDMGVEKMQSHRWQLESHLPDEAFEEHVARTKKAEQKLTSVSVQRKAKEYVRQQARVVDAERVEHVQDLGSC